MKSSTFSTWGQSTRCQYCLFPLNVDEYCLTFFRSVSSWCIDQTFRFELGNFGANFCGLDLDSFSAAGLLSDVAVFSFCDAFVSGLVNAEESCSSPEDFLIFFFRFFFFLSLSAILRRKNVLSKSEVRPQCKLGMGRKLMLPLYLIKFHQSFSKRWAANVFQDTEELHAEV